MKKLQEINIDSPAGIIDVVQIMLDKPVDELTDKELKELVKPKKPKGSPKKEENFEWVYKLLETHGRVFVNEKTFMKLDEKRLGNYSVDFLKKSAADEKDGYIIWKM
jgi:hypothetical protein